MDIADLDPELDIEDGCSNVAGVVVVLSRTQEVDNEDLDLELDNEDLGSNDAGANESLKKKALLMRTYLMFNRTQLLKHLEAMEAITGSVLYTCSVHLFCDIRFCTSVHLYCDIRFCTLYCTVIISSVHLY